MTEHHFIINLVIRKDNKILLERRNDSGVMWKFPGGHIEQGENVLEACKREVNEELNINIKLLSIEPLPENVPGKIKFLPNPIRTFMEYTNKDSGYSGPHTHTGFVFLASTEDDTTAVEGQEIKWVSIGDLENEKEIISVVKDLAKQALNTKPTSSI